MFLPIIHEHKVEDFLEKKELNIFDMLQLPIPKDKSEYLHGTLGALIFLDDYGCVLRIERLVNKRDIEHPHLLDPFIKFDLGGFEIGIYPGTKTTNSEEVRDYLVEAFDKDNLDFMDNQIANAGVIPVKTVDFPNGFPVVIDVPSVAKLSHNKQIKSAVRNVQAEFYKEIIDVAKDVIDKETGLPIKEKMQEFWQVCKKSRKNRVTIPGWRENHYEEKLGISRIALETLFRITGLEVTKKYVAKKTANKYSKKLRAMHKRL